MTTSQVAEYLGRHPDWVKKHRDELGCLPPGEGKKPRIYFTREGVDAYKRGRRAE
jgi:hypothetical protein